MEFVYVFVALASGLALGFVIGRLAGKNSTVAALTENRLLKESLAKTESAQAALAQQIQSEFKNIANEVLVSGSRQVHEDAQKQLNTLLTPLQSKLGEFQNRLEQTATAQGRDSAALKEQIRSLTDLNKNVSDEARRLADALKGDAKSRGNWGEMVLERLLEVAGLMKGTHYETQVSLKGEEGDFRPDVPERLRSRR